MWRTGVLTDRTDAPAVWWFLAAMVVTVIGTWGFGLAIWRYVSARTSHTRSVLWGAGFVMWAGGVWLLFHKAASLGSGGAVIVAVATGLWSCAYIRPRRPPPVMRYSFRE
ncbi:CHASE2 domain-containing sensor protein [Rhodococcus sp. PvR099]|nr:CHASE2 domain-containing sensor protein [Rhodococcus sp. PvR099]PTR40620.1 hypothetical protein C8K38_113146 [Rhodococcus sp. OK611]SNX92311.1 hypothetical protein SAMN05447004_113146 [Rhodococcus sp. OK270]